MSGQQIPMIFALKHLHVLVPEPTPASPAELSRAAALMQGSQVIPAATADGIEAFLKEPDPKSMPAEIELKLLRMSVAGWPDEMLYAFNGITAFGAKGLDWAKSCAHHALRLNPECMLARQLVRLLAAKSDVRCPAGLDESKTPNVVSILTAEG